MNIIVKPYGSDYCYCRPDTTWERENKDFYSPECVNELYWAPTVFVRICKSGKYIGKKFASRYYDAFNFGALLYCRTGESSEIAFTSCTDHSSLLPTPTQNLAMLEESCNDFEVTRNGEVIFRTGGQTSSLKEMVEDAVCKASQLTTLRTGDFVAVEMAPTSALAGRKDIGTNLKATYCGNDLLALNLIF